MTIKQQMKVNTFEVKKAIRKVKRLRKLLKEVNSLVDELTSKDLKITISI